MRRMYEGTPEHPDGENIFYYLTVYNEPYPQPAESAEFPGGTAGLEDGILRGLYPYSPAAFAAAGPPSAQILASGAALRHALTAHEMLTTHSALPPHVS